MKKIEKRGGARLGTGPKPMPEKDKPGKLTLTADKKIIKKFRTVAKQSTQRDLFETMVTKLK